MQTLSLALRNLGRQKRRTMLLGGAIAFGIMIVTVIDGFSGAFVANVSGNFSSLFAGHVFIEGQEKSPKGRTLSIVRDDAALTEAAREAGVEATYISRRSAFEGFLKYGGRSVQMAVQGVDFASETFLSERLLLASGSLDGMAERDGLVIAEPIAEKLGAAVGDRILVQLRTYTGQQNVGEFAIAAIVKDPGILGSLSGYANKAYVNELLALEPEEYQTLSFYLPSLDQMDTAGNKLYEAVRTRLATFERKTGEGEANPIMEMMRGAEEEPWTGVKYRVYTLNDALPQAQQAAGILQTASFVILVLLFLIIMVGITNTFRIIMYERIREIGTMRAVGMQRPQVWRLFLFEALFLALGGALAGLALGILIMLGLGLIDFGLNSPLFIILKNGHLSFKLETARVLGNVILVAALTLLAAWRPARKAARLDPAVALRTAM